LPEKAKDILDGPNRIADDYLAASLPKNRGEVKDGMKFAYDAVKCNNGETDHCIPAAKYYIDDLKGNVNEVLKKNGL
jgi:hypothetical protein